MLFDLCGYDDVKKERKENLVYCVWDNLSLSFMRMRHARGGNQKTLKRGLGSIRYMIWVWDRMLSKWYRKATN